MLFVRLHFTIKFATSLQDPIFRFPFEPFTFFILTPEDQYKYRYLSTTYSYIVLSQDIDICILFHWSNNIFHLHEL